LFDGINTRLITLNKVVAATSVGVVNGNMLRDLCYQEDSWAEVDFNVVMTDKNEFLEIQGTAEGKTFSKETANSSLFLAQEGIDKLFRMQRQTSRALS
jgi:ribonuclease PH